jgi:phospholipid/cholesterol/gamma-HCH transport system ATP-binding protein
MTNLVEIKNLHYERGDRSIFRGLNITIPRGKVTAIMGPSGSGKTTLLRLISAQLVPTQGEIWVENQNIHRLSHAALYELRKKIGLLFQNGGLFTHLNVFENVAFPLREHTSLSEAMLYNLVLVKLEMVGLRGAHGLMPSELSGGMARRVALARAISLDPALIMYDEPLSGQDPITLGVLLRLMRMLNDTLGLTTIIVSHDVQEMLELADYCYIISDGVLIGKGTVPEIRANQTEKLNQFLQGLPDGPVPFHYPAKPIAQDLFLKGSDI